MATADAARYAHRPRRGRRGSAGLLLLAGLLVCGGCTLQRVRSDTGEALAWTRLATATRVDTSARWQLPPDSRIRVRESAPAPERGWLIAAQQGIDDAFPRGAAHALESGADDIHVIVTWPDDGRPLTLRVAVVRTGDGALIDSGELRVSRSWLRMASREPELIRTAFRDFARGMRARR
ncbi:MAG: hypothetical protein ACODAC_11795 [Pseudomonadota bacterium]